MEEVAYQRFSRDLILTCPSTETPTNVNRIPVKDDEGSQEILRPPILERESYQEPDTSHKAQLNTVGSKVPCREYNIFCMIKN